jgi:hypothetical protein
MPGTEHTDWVALRSGDRLASRWCGLPGHRLDKAVFIPWYGDPYGVGWCWASIRLRQPVLNIGDRMNRLQHLTKEPVGP